MDYRFRPALIAWMGKLSTALPYSCRIVDLAALRKEEWAGLEWLTQGTRIDEDMLSGFDGRISPSWKSVYKHCWR